MKIDYIDIIHFTHTDYGFTDHQLVCKEMRRRYLDEAIDIAVLNYKLPKEEHFYWTCEGTLSVLEWWKTATKKKRETFIRLVKDGFIEVGAIPFNTTSFLSAEEWDKMLNWLPDDLWNKIKPKTIVQNDINGFSRAGAIKAYKKGIRYLWMGVNTDTGGSPFPQPTPFIWKLPGGKELFCFLALPYPWGYFFFHKDEWRRGPLPKVYNTAYRIPNKEDIFRIDRDSLAESYKICMDRLKTIENKTYPYKRLIISFTNMWRMDNDPAISWTGKFVSEWNKAGFVPKLRFTIPSVALKSLEEEKGAKFPVYEGEWTDWWANGPASAPRELSVSRDTKRTLIIIENSSIFKLSEKERINLDNSWRKLCIFNEHTWGAGESVSEPYSISSVGQHIEKYLLAYRPFEISNLILGDKVREKLSKYGKGVYLLNPTKYEYTGWVYLKTDCIRGDYNGLENTKTGEKIRFIKEKGEALFRNPEKFRDFSKQNVSRVFVDVKEGKNLKFWIKFLKAGEIRKFNLIKMNSDRPLIEKNKLEIKEDINKWPIFVKWEDMRKPLYQGDIGKLITLDIKHFTPRWKYKEILALDNKIEKLKQIKKHFMFTEAVSESKAKKTENDFTIIYEQYLRHYRMKWFYRRLEIFKNTPKILLKVRFYRKSDPAKAEIYYIKFNFPFKNEMVIPVVSCGGIPFKPGIEQIPNTCKDYFAIDGFVNYKTRYGNWLWYARDSALVTFGQPNDGMKIKELPVNTEDLLAIVYNNIWYTNWAGDENGVFEFNYEIVWSGRGNKKIEESPGNIFSIKPIVCIK